MKRTRSLLWLSPLMKSAARVGAFSLAVTVSLILLPLAGCGGGGSSSSSSPANTQNAQTGLNNIISGQTPATGTNIGANAALWQGLYNQSPSNQTIAAGFAISNAAAAGENFDTALGSPFPNISHDKVGNAIQAHFAHLGQFGQALSIWKLPSILGSQGGVSWPQAIDFTAIASPALGGSQIQADLDQLDVQLAQCETALNTVLANPSFVFTIPDPSNPTSTLKMGSAEFDVLYTLVALLRGAIAPLMAYDLSEPGFNGNKLLNTVTGVDLTTNGTTVTSAEYLAASPFLTLNAGGATDMARCGTQLNTAATRGTGAINLVESRNNAGFLLDPGTLVTDSELNTVKAQIAIYQGYLSGPFTATVTNNAGQGVSTTINLSNWFSSPPPDLKAFFPTYDVSVTSGMTTLTLAPGQYPDLTFDALFPSGYPTSLSGSNIALGPFDAASSSPPLYIVDEEGLFWLMPGLESDIFFE